ncbi:MAG: DUF4254 domain-containing protein [bacterium]
MSDGTERKGTPSEPGVGPEIPLSAVFEPCSFYDRAQADWYRSTPDEAPAGDTLASLLASLHFSNFTLWGLEDQARRTDVDDSVIAGLKRSIDAWNQRRNDLIERIDERILAALPAVDPSSAELHSETAGQILDRLSILSLKVWHMRRNARLKDPSLAAECAAKAAVLERQRADLAGCLNRLYEDVRAGRRFFKQYRQYKTYNDPRLNPALSKSSEP